MLKYCTDFVHTRRREAWWPNYMSGEGKGERGFIVSESNVTARGRRIAKNNVRPSQMSLYVMVLEADDN